VETTLSALTEMGAWLYLANASAHPLVFIHAVTGPAALRILLPHMPGELHTVALAYGWQALAAWVAAYGGDTPVAAADHGTPPAEPEIVERAVDTSDHHAIKFVEACVREYRLLRQPVYLTAALDWPNRLLTSRHWSAAERVAAGIAIGWDPIDRRAIAPGRR
jgi:hypothetical protein